MSRLLTDRKYDWIGHKPAIYWYLQDAVVAVFLGFYVVQGRW
jgi:hypothetical protein